MEIDVRVRGGQRADWGPLVRERLRFSLRRLAGGVARVRVQLDDLNGPRAGAQDKRCRLQLLTRDGRWLRREAQADDWRRAFASALDDLCTALRAAHRRARPQRPGWAPQRALES